MMKIFVFAFATFAFLCLDPFALGESDRYRMAIDEKGTQFVEEIDIDGTQDAEVFRVPAHNGVDGADFYHDFKMRLTATRLPARKVCYISKMNPSLSPPGKLKADFNRAASLPTQLPVQTNSHLVAVTGPANRLVLTREILDFCGALPIYNTDTIKGVVNGSGSINYQVDRQKRTVVQTFIGCNINSHLYVVTNCPDAKWNLNCKFRMHSCYYYVTCHNMQPRASQWNCSTNHLSNNYPVCCDLTCP